MTNVDVNTLVGTNLICAKQLGLSNKKKCSLDTRQRKSNNTETLAAFVTQGTGRREKKQKTQKKKKATRTPQKPGVTQVFAKTPAVLLMYTVKSGKSLGSDRGKKTPT